uniref:Synaptotagmin-like protein 1 n=1 Tax=Crocodylus porosus TaxID=8502 RepID=A0A7M4E5G2_CROPO
MTRSNHLTRPAQRKGTRRGAGRPRRVRPSLSPHRYEGRGRLGASGLGSICPTAGARTRARPWASWTCLPEQAGPQEPERRGRWHHVHPRGGGKCRGVGCVGPGWPLTWGWGAPCSPQSNGALQNGQDGLVEPPPRRNGAGPPQTLLTTSSSVSSLGSTLSGSMMSLYSEGDVGSVEVCGCIQLSLHYEATRKELRVHVVQCRGLAQAKKRRSDPYVKTYLLPDKSNHGKRKTAIKKRSLDPVFNETLKYKMEKDELQSRVLNASVWHHDPLGRNLFLGEVEIALSTWDWGNVHPEWFNLQPRVRHPPHPTTLSRGKLNLALKFIPAGAEGAGLPPTGELHIWVKDAQSLIPLRGGTMDSSVQCYVLPDDSKASRQKTRVVKRSLTPLFNHTMVYDGFQAKDLSEACAEFTLWHHENFSKQLLGGLRLSLGTGSSYGLPVPWMDSTEEERRVWGRLLQQPCLWVEALLPLRTNLTPRT